MIVRKDSRVTRSVKVHFCDSCSPLCWTAPLSFLFSRLISVLLCSGWNISSADLSNREWRELDSGQARLITEQQCRGFLRISDSCQSLNGRFEQDVPRREKEETAFGIKMSDTCQDWNKNTQWKKLILLNADNNSGCLTLGLIDRNSTFIFMYFLIDKSNSLVSDYSSALLQLLYKDKSLLYLFL